MSMHVKIEPHTQSTFKLVVDRGDFSVSGVSASLVAELLKAAGDHKLKMSDRDVERLLKSSAHISKSDQDRKFLEGLVLASKG